MTSLSDPNQKQNLKLDSENQKSKWSLEPDLQGTGQECGRFQDLTPGSGQAIPKQNLDPSKQEGKECFQGQSHRKSQNQEFYFDRQEIEEQTRNTKLNEFYYQYFKPLVVDKQQYGLGMRLPILPEIQV